MSATDTRDPAAMPPWVPRAIALFFAGVVGLVALGWLLLRLRSLLVILLLSLTISFALEPAVNRLERAGLRRGTATLLTFVVSAVVTGLFLWIIGRAVADQAAQLIESGPAYIERVREWADRTFGARFDTGRLLSEFQDGGRLSDAATAIAPNIVAVGSRVLVVLFQMLTVATFSFYLVSDGPRLRRAICALLPPDRQRHVLRAWDVAIDKTGAYIYSRAVLALGSFLFHWVVLLVLGVPSPMALALWIAVVSQFVPVVGTYLAGFLPALVALAERPVSALWLLVAILVYQDRKSTRLNSSHT